MTPLCIICNAAPRVKGPRGKRRLHCGAPSCAQAIRRGDHINVRTRLIQAPVDVILAGYFAPHNVETHDGGISKLNRPDTRSGVGCTAAWAAGV